MHLDDIEHDTVPRVEQYLSKIKVIRKIAHKIISVPRQLENFQEEAVAQEEVCSGNELLHYP